MSNTIPTNNEILALLDQCPDKVVSFANQLFSSECFSETELTKVAKRLVKDASTAFRPHLWEAFGCAIRNLDVRCHSDWYYLARMRLSEKDVPSEEIGAIRDFLSDLRMFSSSLNKNSLAKNDSEWEWYIGINQIARTVGKSELYACVNLLVEASTSQSFLVRESSVEALSILATRTDLSNQDLAPFRMQLDGIITQICGDSDPFVRQAMKTVLPLLDAETQM